MEESTYPKEENKPETVVKTQEKIGLGVKVAITTAVVGAIAAGIFIALLISQ